MRKILVYANANIPDGGIEIEFEIKDDEGDKTQVSLIVDRKLKRQIRRIDKEKVNE